MKNKEQLPEEYQPYDSIVLCGNTLVKVQKIIDDKGFIPLLIGKGKDGTPLVWLKAKTKDGFIDLVDKNIGLINIVSVNIYENENQLDIIINNQGKKYIVLQIEDLNSEPKITKLDLRTIGYNILGDQNELKIGNTIMTGSQFQAQTLIEV